jgi:hypothetical protein
MKNTTHIPITESDAIRLFQPQNIQLPKTDKISKTVITQTRWQSRDEKAPLVVSVNGKYHDLLWLNGRQWTYICSRIP